MNPRGYKFILSKRAMEGNPLTGFMFLPFSSITELAVLFASLLVLAFAGGWAYRGRRILKEQKTLGLLLASKEEHLQFIFNSVPIGISMSGIGRDDTRAWHINDRHLAISGITRDEIAAFSDTALFLERTHPEDRDQQQLLSRRIADGEIGSFDLEKRYVHKDGRVVWVSFTTMKQTLSNGDEVYLHTVTDITKLKEREEELRGARELAEQANQTRKRFIANVSHELRTHISAIIGFTDLLQTTSLSEAQKEFVKTISSSGETVMQMIGEILDLSKVEAGRMELEVRPFSVRGCVHRVTGLMSAQAKKKGLVLEQIIDSSVPDAFSGDDIRLMQILMNLLGNAIKFTDKGTVRLHVGLPDDMDATRVRFCVSDTGIGVTPEMMPKLFHAYCQGDASVSRTFGGTGLGLAIAKALVELMGGSIHVESRAGEGSSFYFDIPVNSADSNPQAGMQNETPVSA